MKKIITLCLVALGIVSVFAQKSAKELKGDKYFGLYNYQKAIDKYVSLDTNITSEGLRNLAESYRLSFQTVEAEKAYAELVASPDKIPEDYYYYAYVLKENKKYLESDSWMTKFETVAQSGDIRVKHFLTSSSMVEDLMIDKKQFEIYNLDINSEQQDFGTSYYDGQIVFASSREGVSPVRRKWNGNKLPFLDLYVSDLASIYALEEPIAFSKVTNKKYHEGPASFNKAGDFMAFTRNSYTGENSEGTVLLKIFFSKKGADGEWSEPKPFHKNSEEYSIAHPHLSEDGNTMYFVSDMPGGFGKADLYKVEKSKKGWGEPENLGDKINTEANDVFPYYQESGNMLFFASEGHTGLGGLDVYVAPYNQGFSKVHNVGAPINSNVDDFGFIVNKEMNHGYFSSNREGGKGDDDIYSFRMLKPFVFGKTIKGVSKDSEGEILNDVTVYLYHNDVVIDSVVTNEEGVFTFSTEADMDYSIQASKSKYFEHAIEVSTKTKETVVSTEVVLEKDPGIALYVLVTDAKTNEPIDSVRMVLLDNFTGENFINKLTDASGGVKRGVGGKKINERLSYNVSLSKEGYFPKTITFNHLIDKPGIINVHELVTGGLSMDQEVEDLSELVKINPIKFDVSKYNIKPEAAVELDKIVEIMNKYPGMIVELGSHTDCRGGAKYNEKLSDNRAKSSAEYIKSKITNPDNISGKGYGEKKILNGCNCEGSVKSTCTKAQHSENRRTEFKVVDTGSNNLKVENNSTDSFE